MNSVSIVEVAPRDGLQNHDFSFSTASKIIFIEDLAAAGLVVIEAASFVNPRAVPKMSDGGEVMSGVDRQPGVRYLALVPNTQGLERAIAAGVDAIALFASATEEFSKANLNASIDDVFARFSAVMDLARSQSLWVRGYLSVAFHCPFHGGVSIDEALPAIQRLADLGCDEIALADTTGSATPEQVDRLVAASLHILPPQKLALHCHDTAGLALSNVQVGYERGLRIFDGSAGGIGGCPFSPGAPGNVATESLVRYFGQRGIETGVDAAAVERAYETLLQRPDLNQAS
ncbi:hydroxymethylglutaryl-CoA lyase [soil metagenome]